MKNKSLSNTFIFFWFSIFTRTAENHVVASHPIKNVFFHIIHAIFLPFSLLLITLLLFHCSNSTAQTFSKQQSELSYTTWGMTGGFHRGTIFKHTPNFMPTVTESSTIYEVSVLQHTTGKQRWHQLYNYPSIHYAFLHARFGDEEVFGQAYGFLPSLYFYTRTKHLNIEYRIGVGLAYLNRPFHPLTNATNNVIGSKLNNVTTFGLGLTWKIHPQWQLSGNLSFTHFSNAGVQNPNLGINVPAYGASFRYYPKAVLPKTYYQRDTLTKLRKPIRLGIKLGMGVNENVALNGPKHPIYIGNIFLQKRLSWRGKLQLGVEINYYDVLYHYIVTQVAFLENEIIKATKVAPYIGYELLLGRLSMVAQLGYYIHNPFSPRGNIPTKLGLQYHLFPNYERVGKNLFVGIYLKTHFGDADYLEMGLGYVF